MSLIDRLKYSLNIQKPGSLTWDNIKLPDPTANTISSGLTPVISTIGRTIPAVVRPATVADPIETLTIDAINQPKISGDKETFWSSSAT